MYRELYEEVGLTKKDVKIVATSRRGYAISYPNGWFGGIRETCLYWTKTEVVSFCA